MPIQYASYQAADQQASRPTVFAVVDHCHRWRSRLAVLPIVLASISVALWSNRAESPLGRHRRKPVLQALARISSTSTKPGSEMWYVSACRRADLAAGIAVERQVRVSTVEEVLYLGSPPTGKPPGGVRPRRSGEPCMPNFRDDPLASVHEIVVGPSTLCPVILPRLGLVLCHRGPSPSHPWS